MKLKHIAIIFLIAAMSYVLLLTDIVTIKTKEPTVTEIKYLVSCPAYQGVVIATTEVNDAFKKTSYRDYESRTVEFGAASNCVFTQLENKQALIMKND